MNVKLNSKSPSSVVATFPLVSPFVIACIVLWRKQMSTDIIASKLKFTVKHYYFFCTYLLIILFYNLADISHSYTSFISLVKIHEITDVIFLYNGKSWLRWDEVSLQFCCSWLGIKAFPIIWVSCLCLGSTRFESQWCLVGAPAFLN